MGYSMDMSNEKEPTVQFPEGWNQYVVTDCKESVSKQGNEMFIVTLALADDRSVTGNVYCISEAGKRWYLKQLLGACGVAASADGVYDWDIPDVLNKVVMGKGEGKEEKWTNRDGIEVSNIKVRISQFKSTEDIPF